MKEKENEWVTISDAMASIVAVLIFFIIAILLSSGKKVKVLEQTLDSLRPKPNPITMIGVDSTMIRAEQKQQEIIRVLEQFYTDITQGTTLDQAIELDKVHRQIKFKNIAFESGSACFEEQMQERLELARENFKSLLEKNSILIIEGYTDSTPFYGTGKCKCQEMENEYYYTDNVGLSAFRALEGKRTLTKGWNSQLSERVVVAGYGLTKYDTNLTNDQNRRVIFKLE